MSNLGRTALLKKLAESNPVMPQEELQELADAQFWSEVGTALVPLLKEKGISVDFEVPWEYFEKAYTPTITPKKLAAKAVSLLHL